MLLGLVLNHLCCYLLSIFLVGDLGVRPSRPDPGLPPTSCKANFQKLSEKIGPAPGSLELWKAGAFCGQQKATLLGLEPLTSANRLWKKGLLFIHTYGIYIGRGFVDYTKTMKCWNAKSFHANKAPTMFAKITMNILRSRPPRTRPPRGSPHPASHGAWFICKYTLCCFLYDYLWVCVYLLLVRAYVSHVFQAPGSLVNAIWLSPSWGAVRVRLA